MFMLTPVTVQLLLRSSSEEERYNLIKPAIERKVIRDHSNPMDVPHKNFVKTYRLSKEAFCYVLEAIKNNINQPIRSTAIPNVIKLAATLRLLAEGSYQIGTGRDRQIGLAQPTMSIIFDNITKALEDVLCPKWIQLRMSVDEKIKSTEYFYSKTGIPGVIGCADGTHIYHIRPNVNEHLFYNKNGRHSINCLVIADYKNRIRYVNAQYGGASHDSLVWNVSSARAYLNRELESREHKWILGDAGYPLEPFMITPYRTTIEGSREAYFNQQHSKARCLIERVFGVLKQRFRCLLYARQLHYSPEKVARIMNICCALHNICIHHNVDFQVDARVQTNQPPPEIIPDQNADNLAKGIRDAIKNNLVLV